MRNLSCRSVSWPMAKAFTISRGSRMTSEAVVVEISEGGKIGRGECMPYPRYGETVKSVSRQIGLLKSRIAGGLDRIALQRELPAGAARNAIDCALWDLEAKLAGEPVWRMAGLPEPRPLETAYTLSLDTPENMAAAARAEAHRPLLKMKLQGEGDLERVAAVRRNAPEARIVVDANEGWATNMVQPYMEALQQYNVSMIEQPLPAGDDKFLATIERTIDLCADESCHTSADIPKLVGRYDMLNIKLDKTGGLTEAISLWAAARDAGMKIMVGCMVASSLAMAPAILLSQEAEVVDLDGPLLLAADCEHPLKYDGSIVHPPTPHLWG